MKILHLLIINIPGKKKRRIENLFVLVAAKDSLVRVLYKNMNFFTMTPNNLTAISAENYSGKVCFLYTQKVHLLLLFYCNNSDCTPRNMKVNLNTSIKVKLKSNIR